MPAFLTPIIASFLTGLGLLILRYIEKKILKIDAEKTQSAIVKAQIVAQNPLTQEHLKSAQDSLDNLKNNLNMKFATKAKAIIFFALLSYSCQASITPPRVKTKITQAGDSINFIFTIYNDGADTAFISSLLITTTGNYSVCDSGHSITTYTPTITDTSIHPTNPPYTLNSGKGIFQFVYNFKAHNRLICPPGTATEVGSAKLKILNKTTACPIYILYTTPNTPSFIGYATSQTSSATMNSTWYLFFQN